MLFTNHIYAFGAKESGTFKQVYSTQSNGTSFVVPQNVTSITVKAWGAGGGGGRGGAGAGGVGGPGGGGGFAQGTITVTPGETLTVYVGGGGTGGTTQSASNSREGGGGGGHTGVYRSTTPLIIAGAGGGGGAVGDAVAEDGGRGGAGGAATGGAGAQASGLGGNPGQGGTQSAGGAGGTGGAGGGVDGEAGEAAGRYRGGGGGNIAASGTGGGAAGGALYGGNAGLVAAATSDSGSGGGGGSGYYGGGGGEGGVNSATAEGGGGGGGGSNYVTGTSTTTTQGGVGTNGTVTGGAAANNTDPDWLTPAGNGGAGGNNAAGSNGNPGRVVLIYTISDAAITSASFVANASSTATTITIPSSAQAGDLAILFDKSINNTITQPTTAIPTGFTSIVNQAFTNPLNFSERITFSYKVLTASDPGASITGMGPGTFSDDKLMVVFRPAGKQITRVDISTPSSEITQDNPVAQNITMSASTPVIIGIVGYATGSTQIDPRTATGATFSEVGALDLYIKYCIFNRGDTPTDASVDMDDEGNLNGLQSFYMKIS